MTDIYDIKNLVIGLPINVYYSLIYLVFIIVLYFIYKKLISNLNKINDSGDIIEDKKLDNNIQIIDFIKILEDLKKEYLEAGNEEFYSKLINILKDILKNNYKKDISKMTFEEISRLDIDSSLKELIKNIYFKEYMKKIDDSKSIREEYIEKVKSLVR